MRRFAIYSQIRGIVHTKPLGYFLFVSLQVGSNHPQPGCAYFPLYTEGVRSFYSSQDSVVAKRTRALLRIGLRL